MSLTESRKKANRKWNEAHRYRYWACFVRLPAADRQVIIERASAQGLTVSEYVRGLIYADLSAHAPEIDLSANSENS